jgi:glycosyltransferase involved in cell wall biosynthesis
MPNVVVLGAPEPGFAQLQSASRFVVMPVVKSGFRGAAETNCCNAMWHGKPVIAADDFGASDYIIEGQTGYVVPAGDSAALRQRILDLWNDEQKCREMGRKARKHAQHNFTHEAYVRRLLRLAKLCGSPESARRGVARHSSLAS